MSSINLTSEDQQICLQVARDSIQHGLKYGSKLEVNSHNFSFDLQQELASFVTLHKNGELRGCIGALEAYQPLIEDVAEHAFAAAFHDPRFPALTEDEFDLLDLEISVLGQPQSMSFTSEDDLLKQVQAGTDGLILEADYHHGTFLPSVWQQLPDKKDFLNHLKLKAGLPASWWDGSAKISRYKTFSFTASIHN